MKFCICLPSGNANEFADIEAQFQKRGIVYERKNLKSGGAVFEFDENQIKKLPTDAEGPFVPVDDDSGYSFYPADSDETYFYKVLSELETDKKVNTWDVLSMKFN